MSSYFLNLLGFGKKLEILDGKSVWERVRAVNDTAGQEWQGLLPGDGNRRELDLDLRKELIKYGELAQVTYDGFNSDRDSPQFGQTYWPDPEDLKLNTLIDTKRSSGAEKYTLDKYIYAKSFMYNDSFVGWLLTRVLGTYKKREKRVTLNSKYNLQLPEDELDDPEPDVSKEEIDAQPVWMGYTAWSDVDLEGVEGGVDVVVAFRGTIVVQEWLIDANAYQLERHTDNDTFVTFTKEQNGLDVQVHPGFRDMYITKPSGYSSPQKFIREELKRLVNEKHKAGTPVKSITFVGHSLGGAMAIVAASDIGMMRHEKKDFLQQDIEADAYDHDLWKNISLVAFTFAAPRVGNFEFRQQLDETQVRVLNTVNIRDVVPAVPVSGIGITLGTTIGTLAAYVGRLHAKPSKGAERQPIARPRNGSNWLNKLKIWRAVHRYSNSGVRLLLNSDKLKSLRRLGSAIADIGVRHNLEVKLHMLATQYISDNDREKVWRDVALINKGSDGLRKDICDALSIPASWWSPLQHRGLKPQVATAPKGTYWRRQLDVDVGTQGDKNVQQTLAYTNKAEGADELTHPGKALPASTGASKNQAVHADKAAGAVRL